MVRLEMGIEEVGRVSAVGVGVELLMLTLMMEGWCLGGWYCGMVGWTD